MPRRTLRFTDPSTAPSNERLQGNADEEDESDDLAASLLGVATSEDPYVWFRTHVRAVHGIDLAAGMNLPEQVLDYSA